MRAAFYEQNGPAREVLKLGEIDTPRPGPGEVRVKVATSGVNPSDVKARSGATRKIAYPRVIPHSDGAGEIDMVGDGVSSARLRRAGLDVECTMAACLRHLRGIRHAALAAGGPPAGQYEFRGRSLSRHSGDDGLSRGGGLRCRAGRHDSGRRWSRFRRSLCGAIRQDSRRHRYYHHQFAGEGRSWHALPAPITPLIISAKMSANA